MRLPQLADLCVADSLNMFLYGYLYLDVPNVSVTDASIHGSVLRRKIMHVVTFYQCMFFETTMNTHDNIYIHTVRSFLIVSGRTIGTIYR